MGPKRRYSAVVFDYGGTLTHRPPGSPPPPQRDPLFTGKAVAEFLASKGRGQFDPEQVNAIAAEVSQSLPHAGQADRQAITQRLVEWARRLYERLGIQPILPVECEELACNYRWRSLHRWQEIPDENQDVIRELTTRRCRLGVLSNNDGYVEDRLLKEGLRHYFEILVDSAKEGVCKPDPAIFEIACERLRLGPEDCLYVGDSLAADVAGALAAGWDVAWLRVTDESPAAECQPTYCITALSDLLEVLSP